MAQISEEEAAPPGESLDEEVARVLRFREAAAEAVVAVEKGAFLRQDRLRKRRFLRRETLENAITSKKPLDDDLLNRSMHEQSCFDKAYKRYMDESSTLTPGALSKFGDGNGSFWDSFLTNHRFASTPDEIGSSKTTHLSFLCGDIDKQISQRPPRLGMKQWAMSHAELTRASNAHDARHSSSFETIRRHRATEVVGDLGTERRRSRRM